MSASAQPAGPTSSPVGPASSRSGEVLETCRTWGELIPPAARLRIAIVTILLALVYWSTIRHELIGKWQSDGNWSHGWLIPAFSLYFLASRREVLFRSRPRSSYVGAAILAAALVMYFVSVWVYRIAYPGRVSLVVAIFGLTLLMGGWGVIRTAYFPILFLLLAIPLPQRLYVQLTMPLRALASTVAAAVMPLFAEGLHTEAQGTVIDYIVGGVPGQLNVEEACSGLRSMMAITALGVAIAYLGGRPIWQRLILVASCIPIAIVCNAVRVTTTGLLIVHGHGELAAGTPHAALGLALYGIALGLFMLLGFVLSHLFVEAPEDMAAAPESV